MGTGEVTTIVYGVGGNITKVGGFAWCRRRHREADPVFSPELTRSGQRPGRGYARLKTRCLSVYQMKKPVLCVDCVL